MSETETAPPSPPENGEGALLEDWPLRPWVLAALLALAGLVIHIITDVGTDDEPFARWDDIPWRVAAVSFTFFGGLALAFTLNLRRAIEAVIFAAVIGVIMGGIAWHVVSSDGQRAAADFSFAAGVFFSLLALPLFQAGFHRKRFATDYRETHFHVWSDAISGAGALAFVGISWALLYLIDSLFELVGITFVGDLIEEEWFGWMWSGGVFGAALGVLLNNLKIIGALQRVVMLVFALLAVPFAVAILVFLVVLIASGGQALWEATDDATPILLSCAAGCFVFFNTIIRDSDEERSANRVMQVAGAVLAGCILPLTLFAAISMGIRIDQYGLAPERIWALIAIAVATMYGVACVVALIRGRIAGWSRQLRLANLNLAVVACVVAFLLSLPLIDFGGVSARNQVARLDAGKVTAEEFDFAALKFDFGASGEAVLAELAAGEGEVATLAAEAQALTTRPYRRFEERRREEDFNFRLVSDDPELRSLVVDFLINDPYQCEDAQDYCVILDLGEDQRGRRKIAVIRQNEWDERPRYSVFAVSEPTDGCEKDCEPRGEKLTLDGTSRIGIETFERRYITIDGEPIGEPLDDVDMSVSVLQRNIATSEASNTQ